MKEWWGGRGGEKRKDKSGADSGIYFRGAPCIGEGSGDHLGPSRSRAATIWALRDGGSHEAPGN